MSQFAPEYSKRERILMVVKAIAVVLPIYLLAQFWFIDWLGVYAATAHCRQYGNINGMQLLLYGLFVFMPLSFVLLIGLLEGKRAIRVLRLGQNPLPGEKVLGRRKYRYGNAARIQPIGLLTVLVILVGISIWGYFHAEKISRMIPDCSEEARQELARGH
jgi:hypothetical protein